MDAAEQQQNDGPAAAEEPAAAQQEVKDEADRQVSDEEVKERLLVLLGKSDLAKTTEKMIRKQLEKELGVNLNSKKTLIRQEVLAYLEQHQQEDEDAADEAAEEEEAEEEEEEEEAKPAKKRRGGSGSALGSVLSEPLQEFLGVERLARTQVVKAIWDYIKQNNLQNPKDKRKILVDDKLRTIFTPPITMFNMNKQLSKHVFSSSAVMVSKHDDSDEEEEDDDDEPAPRKAAAKRPAKRAKKSSEDGDGGGKSSRAGTGFAKPLPLSKDLAAACGQTELSRGAFMKWLYDYVNKHNLKDPSDKRYCQCDATLEKLTGEKRFLLFGSQKLFKDHFLK